MTSPTSPATVAFMTGGSGGLGKSSGARSLAHALGLRRIRTCLVDGNPGQQSQRTFLHIAPDRSLEHIRVADDIRHTLAGPNETHAAFALLPGPATPTDRSVPGLYVDAILALRDMCDMVIVDADRIDAAQWDDPRSFAGRVMRPMVEEGARLLFRIGRNAGQLDDGLAALDAIRLPDHTLAIGAGSGAPRPERFWHDMLDGLAQWGGDDEWDDASRTMIADGRPGWPMNREPAWVGRAAAWLGADPALFDTETRRRGFRWPWTR